MLRKHFLQPLLLLFAVSTVWAQDPPKINMARKPVLVRMVVRSSDPVKRVPIKSLGQGSDEYSLELARPIQNIVVLVHGHNETEKAGWNLAAPELNTVGYPWFIDYKRDVWTNFYGEYSLDYAYFANDTSTAFYEFIYPTYLPIYSGEGNLSNALSIQLAKEMAGFVKKGLKPNIFIVAHSMGGLVARAAIQKFTPEMDEAFQKLVTWGAPHHGSALVSTRYASDGPYTRIPISPLSTLINNSLMSAYLTGLQANTPGARDLRWDNIHPLMLENTFQIAPGKKLDMLQYDLKKGTWLYSTDTRKLNETDVYRGPGAKRNILGKKKYAFLYGITSKVLPFCKSDICFGASVTALVNDGYFSDDVLRGASDGAVPVASLTGAGIDADLLPVGDIDHEEYFGAPLAGWPGKFTSSAKAQVVAKATLDALQLQDYRYKWVEKLPGSYIIKFGDFEAYPDKPSPFPESFTYQVPGFHTPRGGIIIIPAKDGSFSFQFEDIQKYNPFSDSSDYNNRHIKVQGTGMINAAKATISIDGIWSSYRKASTSDYVLVDQKESGKFKISGSYPKPLIPAGQNEQLELAMEGTWSGSLLLDPGPNGKKDWALNASGKGKCPSKIIMWLKILP